MKLVRVKKTGQPVMPMGTVNTGTGEYELCLFPFDTPSRSGQRGVVQPVRKDNLIDERQWPLDYVQALSS